MWASVAQTDEAGECMGVQGVLAKCAVRGAALCRYLLSPRTWYSHNPKAYNKETSELASTGAWNLNTLADRQLHEGGTWMQSTSM